MADITYDRVRKVYPDGTVTIPRFDLKIDDGEFMVLVGPSGCGKSTALRMTAGLEEISGGRILLGDEVVNGQQPARPRHRHGLPGLRAVPAHDRRPEHGLRPADDEAAQGRGEPARQRSRRPALAYRPAGPPPEEPLRRSAPTRRHGPRHRPPTARRS